MNLMQLNRLRNEQSTSFLKVFGTDLALDLDSSMPSRLITNPSVTGNVAIFEDGSSYKYDATQPNTASQGTTGTTSLNGLNTLNFIGGKNMFLDPNLYDIPSSDNTIFTIVKKNTTDTFTRRIIAMSPAVDGNLKGFFIQHIGNANLVSFQNGLNGGTVAIPATLSNYTLITCRRMGTQLYISVNNGTPNTNNGGSDITGVNSGRLFINSNGIGFNFVGEFAQLVIIKRACTDDEISFVNNKLMTKWGL